MDPSATETETVAMVATTASVSVSTVSSGGSRSSNGNSSNLIAISASNNSAGLQLQTHLVTAVAVENIPIPIADPVDPETAMNEEQNRNRNRKRNQDEHDDHTTRNILIMVALGALVALVITLAVVLTRQTPNNTVSGNNNNNSNNSNNNNNSINNNNNNSNSINDNGIDLPEGGGSGGVSDESGNGLAEQEYMERRDAIIAILEPLYDGFEGGVEVFNESSPFQSDDRIKALDWVIRDDPILYSQIPVPVATAVAATSTNENENVNNIDVNDTSIGSGETEINNENGINIDIQKEEYNAFKVRQRYALALLYMSTNGEDWDNKLNFLLPVDECSWTSIYSPDTVTSTRVISVKGVVCNDKGGVENIVMWWNNMSGTIPHELSAFSESLQELNLGGNSMTGTIPPSLPKKLTNLKTIALSDNCFTSTIPKGFVEIPSMEIFAYHNNNYGLTPYPGDMEKLCDSNGNRKERVVALTVDCPSEEMELEDNATRPAPWGCDCCICCSPEKYECQDLVSGGIWPSFYKDDISKNGLVKGFDTKCVSTEQESWIATNCPCVTNITTNPEAYPFLGNCTTDCTQEGAIPSYDFGG